MRCFVACHDHSMRSARGGQEAARARVLPPKPTALSPPRREVRGRGAAASGQGTLSAISRVTQLKVPRKRGRFRERDMHFRHAVCGMEWNTAQSIRGRGRVVRLVTRDVCTRLDALVRHFHRHCVEVCLVFRGIWPLP